MSRRALVPLLPLLLLPVLLAAVLLGRGLGVLEDTGGSVHPTTTGAPTTTTTTVTTVVGEPGAPGVGDPYFPGLGNGGYDVEHYSLDLIWRADEGVLEGVATIDAVAEHDLSRFNLDLVGLEVETVTVDGQAATMAHEGRELSITPPADIAAGDEFTTQVTYGGSPRPIHEGTNIFDVGWQTHGREAFVVSEPSGAATFFPVNDHPTDKATYTIRVTAPADQVVAATGLMAGEPVSGDGGTRTWTYEASDLTASYLLQLAIGDLVLVEGEPVDGVVIRHAFHRSVADVATRTVARTAEMIELLADIYGPYPFEAYGVLAVDQELGFALETQTLTIIGRDLATAGSRAESILLHELAHQWVGNSVSPSTWQDIWLNEGFATYSEWLWSERTGGADAASMARNLHGSGERLDLPPGDPGGTELFDVSVYWRGGMALQALREAVGDDAFFAVLRTWVDDFRDSTASTGEFIELAERTSGQDLQALFDAWLYADRLPDLAG